MDYEVKVLFRIAGVVIVLSVVAVILGVIFPQEQEETEVESVSERIMLEQEYNKPIIRPKQPEMIEKSEVIEQKITETNNSEIDDLSTLGKFRVTAYCPCEKCCGKWANTRPNGIVYGASGAELKPNHSIAVDTDIIPYGKSVFIDGIEYVAHDCGGAIKGNCIDIYMDSHEAAVEFGVKNMMVYEREY